MVDFKSLSEACKWRQSKVCRAIGNYCEIDNCALYDIIKLVGTQRVIGRRKRKKRKVVK